MLPRKLLKNDKFYPPEINLYDNILFSNPKTISCSGKVAKRLKTVLQARKTTLANPYMFHLKSLFRQRLLTFSFLCGIINVY